MRRKPAVILSGHTMALGVVRALGEKGVPVVVVHYDERDMAHTSKYVRDEVISPNPVESEERYIEFLIQYAGRFENGLLVPTSDETLVSVSRHKELLKKHYIVACTDRETTERFIDKKHTYMLATEEGVPAPKTIVPQTLREVEEHIDHIEFPCLLKPSQGHSYYGRFKRKMILAEDKRQLVSAYLQAEEAGLEVMLQEVIPGDDSLGVNYNAYFWNDEPLVEFTAQQLRNAPPDFGSPRVAVSKSIPDVLAPGRKILQAIGFYGYACTEFKQDPRDGVYKLMEVNGRHNLSSLLAVRCGTNFPWIQYQHLVYGEEPSVAECRQGVYWIDFARDAGYSLLYLGKEKHKVGQYLRPYLHPHAFAILDLADPAPFAQRMIYLIGEAVRAAIAALRRRAKAPPVRRADHSV